MEEEFFVILSYQGNEYTVQVEDPTISIQELINKIMLVLGLSRVGLDFKPVIYALGRWYNGEDEILYSKVNGEEKYLIDYQVQPGDRLTLEMIPVAG